MSNGYVLQESRDYVVIATGFESPSENTKTGPMIQVWILATEVNPVTAIYSGKDSAVCGDCPLRGDIGRKRSCYVNVHNGPLAVWNAWKRGRYPKLENYKVFADRAVRFGAYGDPFLIDAWILRAITRVCAKWTGYTHMWKDATPQYRKWLMASCDSIADRDAAKLAGWRTFRTGFDTVAGEIVCPASAEAGSKTTCHKCGLCNGSKPADPRKDIVIAPHGRGAKYFTVLA